MKLIKANEVYYGTISSDSWRLCDSTTYLNTDTIVSITIYNRDYKINGKQIYSIKSLENCTNYISEDLDRMINDN